MLIFTSYNWTTRHGDPTTTTHVGMTLDGTVYVLVDSRAHMGPRQGSMAKMTLTRFIGHEQAEWILLQGTWYGVDSAGDQYVADDEDADYCDEVETAMYCAHRDALLRMVAE